MNPVFRILLIVAAFGSIVGSPWLAAQTPPAPRPETRAPEKKTDEKPARKPDDPSEKKPAGLLDRVVTVGASVTHGFGNNLPLAELVEESIQGPHAAVKNFSKGLQFLDPVRFGEEQIDQCLGHRATLVIGVDFLFWYAYGPALRNKTELERRLQKFRLGLKQLERLTCPVVVGDLPDMTGASRIMLNPGLIPSPPVLAALNQEFVTWARGKKNVVVVPLTAWLNTLKDGKWQVPASPDGKHPARNLDPELVFQWDRLHLSRLGTVAFVDRLVTFLNARFGDRARGLRFDLWKAVAREVNKQDRTKKIPQQEKQEKPQEPKK
jgi:hypothetical protein